MKKKKPLMKDLQRFITSNYSRYWKGIGIALDISIDTLICIEKSHPVDFPSCCNDMLIHWYQFDEKASWNKIIEAIDIVVTSNKNYSSSLSSFPSKVNKALEAVLDLAYRLKEMSKKNRYKSYLKDDNWPVVTPKHFTSVALIHHKGERTKREVLAIANLQKRGNFDLDKIHTDGEYFKQSKCSKDISDIFAKVECADGTTKCPGIILIEGVAGIGKTVLSKEIVFQWANGELLSDHTLVFLIPLRDTESQKIHSVKSFINYFGYPQVTEYIVNYIIDSKGKNVTVVFDGYDELSEKLRRDSFLYKMMTQNVIEIPFCNVVITSRPNASAHLHDKVDLRVEILGFTNEDRKAYIVDALKHDDNRIEKVMTYLNNNPAINAYCYIPLNMTILLSFFENSDDTDISEIPNTQTEINEKFICTTISRYIRNLKGLVLNFSTFSEVQAPCDDHEIGTPCVGHEKGVPYGRIFKEISKLAFKALEKDKIVFTAVELQETCPCLEAQSENWNGLGLLKPVQLFTVENILRNVSFNFLHFTVQEILAAYHITLMSEAEQLKCMNQTFWDNRYYNTWIMYVGLTKNQLPITFKHFLSGNWYLWYTRLLNWWNSGTYCQIKSTIINDKIKCLHLFQCFSEAENNELCQYVGQLLQESKIDLSGQTLSAVNVLTISLFLTRSTTKYWNILNLSECFIGDDGIKQLHNSFASNNRSKVCIDVLNLSHNNLTQSSVESIAGLVLEWDVKDVIFDNINQHNLYQEVMHQVMQYAFGLNNFITFNFNRNEVMFARLSQLDYLILSFSSTSGKRVHKIENIFTDLQANNNFNTDGLKLIIHALNNCTPISYFNLGADISQLEIFDMVALITNNKFMEYLCLPKMQYSTFKMKMIIEALKSNKSLQYVDMSLITIDSDLISDIVVVMNNNSKLKEIKVSKLILRHNDFQYLGNYLVNITGLKSLIITGCIFNIQDADKLAIAIKQNFEIWQLNLSNSKIPMDHLLNILSYASIMEKLSWLDLSSCHLDSEETKQILSVLMEMKHLQHVNLGTNIMTSNAISDVTDMIKNNQDIQMLSLPNCVLDQKDLSIIIQAMQTVSSLEYVDFNNNTVDNELASDVALLLTKNSKLKELRFTKLTLNQNSFQHLNNYLVKIKGLTTVNINGCSLIGHNLVTAIENNSEIQELNLSNCSILANQSWSMLSCIPKLKYLNLSQCLLQTNETEEIFGILKHMKSLQHVDLSGNNMESDAINDVAAMIKNNEHIQSLSLPNGIINIEHFKIVIPAMQTVSSLEYVDFSNNTVDNELASDVALLFTKNSKMKEFRVAKLTLNQIGFQYLNNCLMKIKGLTTINITGCSFKWMNCLQHVNVSANIMEGDAINDVAAMIKNNQDIQVLSLRYCVLDQKNLRIIIQAMQTISSLEYVDFNNITVDNELASDVAVLFTKNSKIKEFKFTKLTLDQIGFQHLNNYIVKIKGLTTINIIGCSLLGQNAVKLETAINNNPEIQELNLSNCRMLSNQSWSMLSNITKLKYLNMSQCILQSNETKEIFGILKWMKCLQHVDLSGNNMESDAINDVAAMIKNNKHIQSLSLPNGIINKEDFKMVSQTMQTVSSLQYVDFGNITVDDELASDVALLFTKNSKMKEIRFAKLSLNQIGFHHLNNCLVKIKGLTTINIIGCSYFQQNPVKLVTAINNSSEIQELNLSKCKMPANRSWFMLSRIAKLKYLNLCQCLLQPNETKKIFGILKKMKYLQHVDLSANFMRGDAINDVAAMIKNNEHIQSLSLPNGIINKEDFKIIFQAMQTVSSLQFIDLNNITVDDELASDVALLFTKNSKMKELRFTKLTLNQIGFQHLNNCLVNIKGLTTINIIGCSFIEQNPVELVTALKNNSEIQELKLSNCRMPVNQSWSMLSCIPKLKFLNLSNCLLPPNETKEIFGILKGMKYLQHIDLSANNMESDAINDVAVMIKNNQDIQVLSLPNCVLDQKDLRIIIQAMQTVSSLEYVDFNNNTVDNELASDVALIFIKNSKLKELRFTKLTLNRTGFQYLNTYLVKIKRLTVINIIGCSIIAQNAVKLVIAVKKNSEIQELNLSNCRMPTNQSWSMLSRITKLKYLNLSNCLLQPNETKEIFGILKWMECLQHVDLSGNIMESDTVNEVAAMIKNNDHIQSLSLPNGIINIEHFKIVIPAMQSISSLEYVDFNNNTVNNELASDVALFFTKNSKMKEFRFTKLALNQIGFQHLNNYLVKIKGLRTINIFGCSSQNAVKLVTVLNNNSEVQELNLPNCRMPVNQSWSMLSRITKLKYLNLSNCLLPPNETKEIFGVLKGMKYLQHVDLSANNMENDTINDLADMIKNNQDIQVLSLPNYILDQKDLRIIIQAMQTVSSLEYVDFNNNTVDNELASDVAFFFTKNSKLKEFRFNKLTLNQIGFQHLNNYLVKIEGLTTINIIGCSFIGQNALKLVTAIKKNSEIQELNLSNCRMPVNQSWSMLSHIAELKYLNLSQCLLQPHETKKIFGILKRMECLQHVDLSANNMDSDSINDVATMIKNNQDIQVLSLPNSVLDQNDLRIIIQAMQTVSSLEYVDFGNNTVDNELASDVAVLFSKNNKLKELRFTKLTLNQIGFQHLNNYLVKIKGLRIINIISCSFIGRNAVILVSVIINNSEIHELNLSKCRMPANQSWSMLSCIPKLKYLNLSQCLLQPNETEEIFGILKRIKCLQHVDLSGNNMESDAINDVAAMIKNNERIQSLSLPNGIINKEDFKIIFQAMQTISSLEYVDFNNNTVDNELASNVALLFTKNSKLKKLRFTKLALNHIGFQYLNNYLIKIKGLTTFNIIGCSFTGQDVVKLMIVINNNPKIQELNLSNCKMPANQSWSMLSCITKLKYLNVSQCSLNPNETKKIFDILKRMKCLQHVDLSGNNMESDAINDIAAMIKNNEHIQSLSLPNGIINKEDFKTIIQAIQSVSSLQYADFSTNVIDNELAIDISSVLASNNKLELNFCGLTLKHSGFQHLVRHFVKLKGIKHLSITDCTFTNENVVYLKNMIGNNKIREILISNCKMIGYEAITSDNIGRYDQLETLELNNISVIHPFSTINPYIQNILVFLSCSSKLRQITICNCQLQPDVTKQVLMVLKYMRHLETVDLSGNDMTNDSVSDMEAMIVNNKELQTVCLPNCVLSQASLKIICHALQTLSSFQCVNFSTNKIDQDSFLNSKSHCITIIQDFS